MKMCAWTSRRAAASWDVSAVVDATEQAKLARKVARLEPLLCVKG